MISGRLRSSNRDLPDNRLNEGRVGPDGAFWVGTMQNNLNPDGSPMQAVLFHLCDGAVCCTFIDWRGQPTVHSAAVRHQRL